MKRLAINFCQPGIGKVKLINPRDSQKNRAMNLAIEFGETMNIPIEGLPGGRWKSIVVWEYDGRDYCYEQEFLVS